MTDAFQMAYNFLIEELKRHTGNERDSTIPKAFLASRGWWKPVKAGIGKSPMSPALKGLNLAK
ncbi:hypothetical protein DRW41_02765 [Neobacillus piezotolerans]|uniref:Uncharacterized protein n=1 Tax=Neobacillus piezotolerans TaxID=2259171 RepID=A0A3D8GVV6_9BACI|nr:hypothetical protein DRW41_02765 [Neobacillus piezotolerans]